MPEVVCPSPDHRIEEADEVFYFGGRVLFDDLSDFAKKSLDALLGRFNNELAVLSYCEPEKVESSAIPLRFLT